MGQRGRLECRITPLLSLAARPPEDPDLIAFGENPP